MRGFSVAISCAAILLAPVSAFGWDPILTHPNIVSSAFGDPTLASLAREYLSDSEVNSITGFQGDSFGAHHDEYSAFTSRLWTQGSWWTDVDEITKLEYLGHNCGDSTVPVDHYPASTVWQHYQAEQSIELQLGGNGGYPHSVGGATWSDNISFSYTGTYSDIMNAHYNAVRDNATWFMNAWNNCRWYVPTDYTNADHTAGWTGVNQASKFARVVFTDYFLAKKDTVANAGGTYTALPGQGITFSGSGQDPDSITWNSDASYANNGGGLTDFSWDLSHNGSYVSANTTGQTPTLNYSQLVNTVGYTAAGKSVCLRVQDDEGKFGYAQTTVKVYANPVANANGAYAVTPGGSAQFSSAGSSDADGSSLSYQWNLGGHVISSQNPTLDYNTLYNYLGPTAAGRSVSLTVTGSVGLTSTATTLVKVYTNPVANANGSYTATPTGGSVTLSSAGTSDADGSSLSYQWNLGGHVISSQNPTLDYNTLYNYLGPTAAGKSVSLTVTGSVGLTSTATTLVKVYTPPVAAGKAQYGWLGKTGDVPSSWEWDNLNDNGSTNPDGAGISTWSWDLNNDGVFEKIGGSSSTVYYSDFAALPGFTPNRNQTVTLKVTDSTGMTSIQSGIKMPVLSNPVASALNASVSPGHSVTLAGSGSSTDGGSILSSGWNWDLNGDGTFGDATGQSPTLTYLALMRLGLMPGAHTVSFQVTNDDGSITSGSIYNWVGTATATAQLTMNPLLGGDANGDGAVTVQDLAVLAANFRKHVTGANAAALWLQGDFNGDGVINVQDLAILAAHYRQTSGGPSLSQALAMEGLPESVPEPSTLVCLLCGGLVLVGAALLRQQRR